MNLNDAWEIYLLLLKKHLRGKNIQPFFFFFLEMMETKFSKGIFYAGYVKALNDITDIINGRIKPGFHYKSDYSDCIKHIRILAMDLQIEIRNYQKEGELYNGNK